MTPSFRGSGFKNLHEFLLFIIGAAGLGYYLISVQQSGGHLNLGVLAFFGTVMGLPVAIGSDKSRNKGGE
jgi:hypothetical protein